VSKRDKIDRKLNRKKIDVSKYAIGDACSFGRYNAKDNISP
jgi:hypothetical protein